MNTVIRPDTTSTSFHEIKNLVFAENNYRGLDKKYQWYAYKQGASHGPFNTIKEAEGVSRLTEKVCVNEDEYKANSEWYNVLYRLAHTIRQENVLDELGVSLTDYNKNVVASILDILGEDGEEQIGQLYDLFNKLNS